MLGPTVTIAITGVAGAVGSRCLTAFAAAPFVHRVVGVDSRPLGTSAPKSHFELGDLTELDLTRLFADVDVVLHVAGADTASLRAVLDACQAASVKQVITLSSAAVFGAWNTNPVPLAEDAPLRPNPGFAYAAAMAERERMVSDWADDHPDVKVALLRMAMIVGAKGGTSWINALGGIGLHQHLDRNRPVQFLHIDDAVSAIQLTVEKRLSGVFNVAPKNFIGDAAAKAVAGVQPRPPLPRQVALVVNRALWRRTSDVDFDGIRPYLEHPWVISSDRIRKEGWTSSYTSEEALVASERPTWWGNLRPAQRRAALGAASAAFSAAGAAISVAIAAAWWRSRHP